MTGLEKNHVRQNRTVRGLWDYTMPRHRKIALDRGIALLQYEMGIFLFLNQNRFGVKSILVETVLGKDPLYMYSKTTNKEDM